MIRWMIALAILLALLPPTAPIAAQCDGHVDTYADVVMAMQPTHLIGYWQLNETTGTTAEDSSGNNYDGTYSGATLAAGTFVDGSDTPTFDGVNDYVNIYSSGLAGVFSSSTGTVSAWLQMSSTNWNTTTRRRAVVIGADTNNRVLLTKSNVVNQVQAGIINGGTQSLLTFTKPSNDFFHVAITWSDPDDRVKVYLNGTQTGSTLTGLGTWSGSLASTLAVIGAANATPVETWIDSLAHVALWKTELTSGEVATIATVPTGATPTPCPTTDISIWETLAPAATGQPGQLTRFDYVVTAGQVQVNTMASALLYSLWGFFLFGAFLYFKRRRNG